MNLDQVLDLLSQFHQRATYGAVAGVVGGIARGLMQNRPRNARNSWVVKQGTGDPSGYDAVECDPDLYVRDHVIEDAVELQQWLQSPH